MSPSQIVKILFPLAYLGFFAFLLWSAPQLPSEVASHFNAAGRADNWMSRAGYLRFTALFGGFVPLLMPLVCYLVRYFPASYLNLPNRHYWLSAERRVETNSYVFNKSWWLGCLMVGYMTLMQYAVLQANRGVAPEFPTTLMWAGTACFIAGVIWWVVSLILHFLKVPTPTHPVLPFTTSASTGI